MWFCILVVNMAELQCDLREEQKPYCKNHGFLGKCASAIKTDIDLVYGENTLQYRTIARWLSMFTKSRTNVKDDPRPGRPISATSEEKDSIFKAIIDEDARYTVEINETSSHSASCVFSILKEKLKCPLDPAFAYF
jgi:hypothetical protein